MSRFFTSSLLAILLCGLVGCTANSDPRGRSAAPQATTSTATAATAEAEASDAQPNKEMPVSGVSERIRVDLIAGKAMAIPALHASVTLLSAERVHHRAPDGSRYESVRGRVLFTQGDESVEVSFTEGSGFEQFGHPMAIFGNASDLELSVFPPGATVRP